VRHVLRGDGRSGAGAILDHDRLAERAAELVAIRARHGVGGAPGRETDDEADGLARIALSQGVGAEGAERDCGYPADQLLHRLPSSR
jgi:hypothetical protein